jgi:hypothetical protein
MRFGKFGKLLHHDCVALGEGRIDRYTLFEIKPLGGVILNVFNSVEQDRFHTHAFNAISVMIFGAYREEIRTEYDVQVRTRRRDIRFLPRTLEHRILNSTPNAISVTICGPWKRSWTETSLAGRIRRMTWGRKPLL